MPQNVIQCDTCGGLFPLDAFSAHSRSCTSYEDNLRMQERMGGSVLKACKDVNDAAPVVDDHSMIECPVCLDNASERTRVRRAKTCNHEFCAACLETWLSNHTTCPVCVSDLSTNGGHRYVLDSDPSQRPTTEEHVRIRLSRRNLEDLRNGIELVHHLIEIRNILETARRGRG